MAGKKENLRPMWADFGKHIDLEPAVPFHKSLYLGAMPEDMILPKGYIEEKYENYKNKFPGENQRSDSSADVKEHLQHLPKLHKTY